MKLYAVFSKRGGPGNYLTRLTQYPPQLRVIVTLKLPTKLYSQQFALKVNQSLLIIASKKREILVKFVTECLE